MNSEETAAADDDADQDRRLNALIAAYIQTREEGRPIDRQVLLDSHPDLDDALKRYFDDADRIEWLVTSNVRAMPAAGAWFGRYRVVGVIGQGGMGVVYQAEEPGTKRRVALKALSMLGSPDPRDEERFRREIELAARLDHPHIVRVVDSGRVGGIPYCTMELIEGDDLRTIIRSLRRADRKLTEGGLDCLTTGPARTAVFGAVGLPERGPSAETGPEYWRFVARVGAQAARALAHAHRQDIWHRDIKPSNLLVDTQGNIHVTDFGLAKAGAHLDLTETGDVAGTLRYLAPERLEGLCGPWSDVYSLGLTLYELLVLRPAFESLVRSRLIQAIARQSPRRPRAINRSIPRDLDTIVCHAIEKEPSHRYSTAAALADDLERFLTGRPILGRPVAPWRRAWGWSRRNPRTAATLATGSLVLVIAIGGILFGLMMSRRAAEARAREAQAQRAVAETARRESHYQSLVLQLQQIRLQPHTSGWSERAWDMVRRAAAIRADSGLRDQAAATLGGIDASLTKHLNGVGASSLAFDREATRLLIGGFEPDQNQDGRARILELTSDRPPVACGLPGPGPVTFRDDGTPLQLVVRPEEGLVLWDLDRRRAVARFEIPGGTTPESLALRTDGSSVAASVTKVDGQGKVLVWDVEPRRLSHQFAGKATALAFSDEGERMATGDEDGRIRVWTLATGQPLAEFVQGRNTIHCLSFSRNPHRDAEGNQGWLLAAGDSGGSIVIWDLATQHPVSRCNGSGFNVYALAFFPDGMTLASAGRLSSGIWDWTTGRPLLSNISPLAFTSSLAVSRDGRKLAYASHFYRELTYSHVYTWDLDLGRGIWVLRGLTAPAQWVLFSPDLRKIAALSHDWRIAIWGVATRRLEAIVDAPKGYTADNATLAFSNDGRRFAAAAERGAKLWDLASGKELGSWPLLPGLNNRIAFCSSGDLLLFRCESSDGRQLPLWENDFQVSPRVCRIRNLLGPDPLRPLAELRDFNRRVYGAVAVADGRCYIVNGWHDGPDDRFRAILALDGLGGKELWSIRYGGHDNEPRRAVLDWTGDHFVVMKTEAGRTDRLSLREVKTGNEVGSLDHWPGSPSPDGTCFVEIAPSYNGISLRGYDDYLLLNLGIDQRAASGNAKTFSADGKRIAWGNADGSVMVAELDEIQPRLAKVGLGWGPSKGVSEKSHE